MTTKRPWITLSAVALTTVLALSACGSDDQTANDATAATADPAGPAGPEGSGLPGGRAGGGAPLDEKQLAAIQTCLDAAGIEADLPTGAPTDLPTGLPDGVPSDLPSDFPTDLPSDFPTDGASGFPGGGGGGGLGTFLTPEVQTALDACGIDLPTVGAPGS